MKINSAKFIRSAASEDGFLSSPVFQFAVVGRSNVGKSSFINYITSVSGLAKTSKQPGRTRLVNYFDINEGQFILVDLPGYGYAEAPDSVKRQWGSLMDKYLKGTEQLKHVFVLVDVRHQPTALDIQMINYLNYYGKPYTIIATKGDKLSRAQINKQLPVIAAACGTGVDNIIVTSALNKVGKEKVFARIEQILDNTE